jgi:hypothetical protein
MLWKQLSPRYRKLLREGERGEAVVVAAKAETSRSDVAGIYGWNVTIRIKRADGTSADFDRYVEAKDADDVSPGMVLPVRFDPRKPSRVEIDTEALRAAETAAAAWEHAAEDERVREAESRVRPLGSDPR